MRPLHIRGFSLVELLMALAIISILAAIAYPSYSASLLKGQRAQGRTALAELAQQQERYMTQKNCYLAFSTAAGGAATPIGPSPSTACGGITASSVPFKTFSGDNLANSAYLLSADACPSSAGGTALSIAECVRVVATPLKADPEVGALRMTSTGMKDCGGTAGTSQPALCWP